MKKDIHSTDRIPGTKLLFAFGILVVSGILYSLFLTPEIIPLHTEQGYGDLRWWKASSDKPVELTGTWSFYPNTFVDPDQLSFRSPSSPGLKAMASTMEVPGLWSSIADQKPLGIGTYHLRLDFNEKLNGSYAVLFKNVSTSYRVYVNGKLAGEIGRVSTDAGSQLPFGRIRNIVFPGGFQTMDLVLHVANFQESNPGIRDKPLFGSAKDISQIWIQWSSFDYGTFMAACLLAIYLLIFFVFRPAERQLLHVTLMAMALALRHLFTGTSVGILGILPNLPWNLIQTVPIALFILANIFLMEYVHASFQPFASTRIRRLWRYGNAVLALAVLILPVDISRYLQTLYLIPQTALYVYLLVVLIQAGLQRQMSAWLHLASILFLEAIVFIDMVSALLILNPSSLIGPGLLVFFLFHSMLFSWRFVSGFERSVDLSTELKQLLAQQDQVHENLERTVVERTRALSQALEESNKANSSKSKFLANVSHEIRTPLNGIIGFTELLRDSPDSPSRNHFFRLILNEASRLQNLIDQLLDFSKIEANKLVLENHPFDLYEMFQTISATIQLKTQSLGLQFNVSLDDKIPRYLRGDALRLRQILDNLLSNALKFTERGSISLSARLKFRIPDKVTLEFMVKDTGIGIPAERIDTIFESFEQGDSSTTRLYGGSGLGTTIAKQLVELMGGTISLSSSIGEGTAFVFTVIMGMPHADDIPRGHLRDHHTEPKWANYPIAILAEDYKVNAELVMRHLLSAGWIVRQAFNGQEAVELYQREPVDLVIMDIQMPIMDGYEASRQIRKIGGKRLPILGLSANAFEEDRKRCIEAGMDTLLSKPVRRHTLLEAIAQYVVPAAYVEVGMNNANTNLNHLFPNKSANILAELDGDLVALMEMIHGFAKELATHLPLIHKAFAASDSATVHRICHGIKGGAQNLGASTLEDQAKKVEQAAKAGNLSTARLLFDDLEREIKRIIDQGA